MPAGLHTRDASGRRVSILNDDHSPHFTTRVSPIVTPSYDPRAPRTASTPATPELLRSDSYDSHMAAVEPASPLTPLYDPGFRYNPPAPEYRSVYEDYYVEGTHVHAGMKRRPSAFSDGRSVTYDDDLYHTAPTNIGSCSSSSSSLSSSSSSSSSSSPPSTSTATSSTTTPGSERPGKRFPCRYRETHGCDKTFTTSGHASRHAKIHTAEKGVNCSFEGCPKRFTRADNMKQHLETHYKDKSRSSISRPSVSGGRRSSSASSSSSSLGKLSSSSSLSSASAAASRNRIIAMTTAAMAAITATATAQSSPSPPPPPPSSSSSLPRMNGLEPALFRGMPVQPPPNGSAWDMRDLDDMLVNRASTRDALPTRTGLDTLALAALRQGSGR